MADTFRGAIMRAFAGTAPYTRMLICEGACNPTRPMIDEEVRAYRALYSHVYGAGVEPVPDHLAQKLRTLQHTPHVQGSRRHDLGRYYEVWACTQCWTERRY